ncbi:hemagglutinin, partial [Yersinia enterocolitica]|nr:hemagglutinin [Yersinia enterocolitica]
VGEHTQLDGAVIASTATADKNTLDTGTLGFSNIGNKADFKVEHQSVGISTGGNIGGQFVGNMANGLLVGSNNEGHDNSTTHAAVSDGTITIRDTDKQQQNVADLSRDVEHANNALSPIFDKEKEQNRLREAKLIGEIGSQVSDVIRTQGKIIATKAANEKMLDVSEKDKVDAKAQWEKANPGQVATAEDINGQVYKTAYDQAFNESGYGTGGKFQQAAQAATAAIQGLAGGDMSKALAGASAPYLAEVIHNMTTDPVTGKVNTEANLMAHAVLGAVMAQINGNNALSGASGALMGEFIAQQLYPDIPRNELSEEQKQTISALGT